MKVKQIESDLRSGHLFQLNMKATSWLFCFHRLLLSGPKVCLDLPLFTEKLALSIAIIFSELIWTICSFQNIRVFLSDLFCLVQTVKLKKKRLFSNRQSISVDSDTELPGDFPPVEVCAERCRKFAEVTDTNEALAQFYLQDRNWNLERSIQEYYEDLAERNRGEPPPKIKSAG